MENIKQKIGFKFGKYSLKVLKEDGLIEPKIIKGITDLFKGGEEVKEEKLEQLRKIFSGIVKEICQEVEKAGLENFVIDKYVEGKVNQLVYEVKIRINNK